MTDLERFGPIIGRTPYDVVRGDEILPPDLTVGYVDNSDSLAEVMVIRFSGIGEYDQRHAYWLPRIRTEFPGQDVEWATEPRIHDVGPSVLWIPPARLEIFRGLIAHPDRQEWFTGQPDEENLWLTMARESINDDLSREKYEVMSMTGPSEASTHLWAQRNAVRGVWDWIQRGIPAEEKKRILAASTIPEALAELTPSVQTKTKVSAEKAGKIVQFFVDAYQSQ
ncbi:MAG TPA: hypothetical protein VF733_00140 [Candidatus Saccharimonadales bacterium]